MKRRANWMNHQTPIPNLQSPIPNQTPIRNRLIADPPNRTWRAALTNGGRGLTWLVDHGHLALADEDDFGAVDYIEVRLGQSVRAAVDDTRRDEIRPKHTHHSLEKILPSATRL